DLAPVDARHVDRTGDVHQSTVGGQADVGGLDRLASGEAQPARAGLDQDVAVERALGRADEAGQVKGPGFVEREAAAAAGRLAVERPTEAYGAVPGVQDDGAGIAGPATHRQGRTGRQED